MMSTNIESRGRTRFFRGGIRGLLSTSSTLRRPDASHEGEQVVSGFSAPQLHAMFQDARNTNIHNATFNIYGSGPSVVSGSSSTESSSTPSSPAGSSSSSFGARTSPGTPMTDIDDPPCVNEPFPVPQTGPEIYVRSLMRQNRGYPLWIPSPNMSLPASYRASGVRLGDVGIITPEGGFSFFFNVLHEATHPINIDMLLPEHFAPYVPRGRTGALVHTESSVMTCLTSDTLMTKNYEDGTTILETSAKEAAVLMMPEPVYLSRLHDVNRFRQYVNEHLEGWYRHIKYELGWDVENGDLRVVYDCRKTAGFGIATVSNASPDSTTELKFMIDEPRTGITGCRYRWHYKGSAEVKAGPSVDDNADIRELQPDGGVPINQCLFLNTIDFTLSDDQWQRIDSDDSVAFSTYTPTIQTTAAKSLMSHELPHRDDSSSSTNSNDTKYNFQSRSARGNGLKPSALFKKIFHPSDVLGKFLLTKVLDAKSVAIFSEDWGPFMTEDVNDANSLIRSVLRANDVCEEGGMVYLRTRLQDTHATTMPEVSSMSSMSYVFATASPNSIPSGSNNSSVYNYSPSAAEPQVNLATRTYKSSTASLANPHTQDVFASIVKGRKSWKTLRGGEVVWPPELEAALIEGLKNYQPDDSRETHLLGRFPMRNRFISDWIFERTGRRRSAKQVGNRLQQLRDTYGENKLMKLLSPIPKSDIKPDIESDDGSYGNLSFDETLLKTLAIDTYPHHHHMDDISGMRGMDSMMGYESINSTNPNNASLNINSHVNTMPSVSTCNDRSSNGSGSMYANPVDYTPTLDMSGYTGT
ncbi:hypothetical protein D9619_002355 [Psilocybe cf. subviscida]|uniref:TEA domain-containing protein n=1 Tax=Psilocybe cf. subviscida TaxID=2480587 RepID=A0A8H5EUH6_9AGAR|nr:hypothetical protein D9619_002355 [Psilocybe cf. subviscida]